MSMKQEPADMVHCGAGAGRALTAQLIFDGALRAAPESGRLYQTLDVHEALRFGLRLCKTGDVLVFGCGSSLSELIEGIQPEMPELAEEIASELYEVQ